MHSGRVSLALFYLYRLPPAPPGEQRHKLFRVFDLLENPYLYTDHQSGARIRALSEQIGNRTEYVRLKNRTILTENITDLDQPAQQEEVETRNISFYPVFFRLDQ